MSQTWCRSNNLVCGLNLTNCHFDSICINRSRGKDCWQKLIVSWADKTTTRLRMEMSKQNVQPQTSNFWHDQSQFSDTEMTGGLWSTYWCLICSPLKTRNNQIDLYLLLGIQAHCTESQSHPKPRYIFVKKIPLCLSTKNCSHVRDFPQTGVKECLQQEEEQEEQEEQEEEQEEVLCCRLRLIRQNLL